MSLTASGNPPQPGSGYPSQPPTQPPTQSPTYPPTNQPGDGGKPNEACPTPFATYRDPKKCGTFIVCSHGTPYTFQCPAGLDYSTVSDGCFGLSKVFSNHDRILAFI